MTDLSDATVTVVIATYKRAHLIKRALNSVAAQTLRPSEIIVVDDGSDDNSEAVVASWSEQHDIAVRFIGLKANNGAGVARNKAMQSTSSTYIAFLDSDDEHRPDALARLIAPLENLTNAVVSFADADQYWDNGFPTRLMMESVVRKGIDTHPIPTTDPEVGWHYLVDPQSVLLLTSPIPTCSAIFRRSAAESVGWMPDYRHGEDWIFWLKLTGQGDFVCQFASTAIVHRQEDNLTNSRNDAHTAQLTLNAFLRLAEGDFGMELTPSNRTRLMGAINEKMKDLRYHASRKGWAYYWKSLASPEARTQGSRLNHILRDPASCLRALLFSL